jgi:hypothetical protein
MMVDSDGFMMVDSDFPRYAIDRPTVSFYQDRLGTVVNKKGALFAGKPNTGHEHRPAGEQLDPHGRAHLGCQRCQVRKRRPFAQFWI